MALVFGKEVETRRGRFAVGDPLPVEWDTRETRKQLIEQFGDGVLVQARATSESLSVRLSAIEESLNELKDALGIKAKTLGPAKGKA